MTLCRLLVLASLVGITGSAASDPPSAGAPVRVGSAVTTKKTTDIDKLAKNPKKYVGRTVRIDGTVKKVCQGAGCWVEVASAKGTTFLAKSLDESVLLPTDCAGRRIVVQGVVTELPARDAETHAHADHAAEGHVCPAPTYLISTQGAELVAAKKN